MQDASWQLWDCTFRSEYLWHGYQATILVSALTPHISSEPHLTLTSEAGYGKRTTATGLQLTIGNAAGVMAPFLYPSGEGPRYIRGHAVTLALVGFAAILYIVMYAYFKSENAKRASGKRDAIKQGLTEEEVIALGDENPGFVFAA